MAKGSIAKQEVVNKIKQVFGNDYVGESNSKHFVWANDGGERVQIAISLTCPKNPLEIVATTVAFGDGIDFEAEPVMAQAKFEPAEISQEEVDNIQAIMQRLGL